MSGLLRGSRRGVRHQLSQDIVNSLRLCRGVVWHSLLVCRGVERNGFLLLRSWALLWFS